MPKGPRHTVLATAGVSLKSNLQEREDSKSPASADAGVVRQLRASYQDKDWDTVATLLHRLDPRSRICGAEINSMAYLLDDRQVEKGRLHLLRSDTPDGEALATILDRYFTLDGWAVTVHKVEDLRDDDPNAFRTRGLRNLAREMASVLRNFGANYCAINATGGYKAQVAIAVLLGQALQVPVYYKHEHFPTIIMFPAMPVFLDFRLWLTYNDLFSLLNQADADKDPIPWEPFAERWDERLESLVDRVELDGRTFLGLSPTGQIFHDSFKYHFSKSGFQPLPPPSKRKNRPVLGDDNWGEAREAIERFMWQVTQERPYVVGCRTFYWNPDLPERTIFKYSEGRIVGVYSNRKWCVKFFVETTARTDDEKQAAMADLNLWLEGR